MPEAVLLRDTLAKTIKMTVITWTLRDNVGNFLRSVREFTDEGAWPSSPLVEAHSSLTSP